MNKVNWGYVIDTNQIINEQIQAKKKQIRQLQYDIKELENKIDVPDKKVDDYINNLLTEHQDDLVKTESTSFAKYWITHKFYDLDNMISIVISGKCDKSFFGKIKDLHDIDLLIQRDNSTYNFHKL